MVKFRGGNAWASSSGDRTTSLAHQESEEDWEQEIVPGTAGYVPHVPTFFQRMRHKSQRQRRRLYREQAVNFKEQEEQRLKAIAYVGPMEETPEVGTWEVANFLQAAWTAAADTDGCVFYKSKYNR
ncbi:hypothetical protein MRX96_026353 [Rhipicephalus microplus]